MFRDDRQICSAMRVLLGSVGLERLWTDAGPTDEALELLEARGGPLSHGEQLMLLVAFDFWNGHGEAELGDLLAVFDAERIELVASLMIASAKGASAVDRWLEEHRPAPRLHPV